MIIKCAISGLSIEVPAFQHLDIGEERGYLHPVFALSTKQLQSLYARFTRGQLSNTESYLAFLATLHSTGKVIWDTCCALDPDAKRTKSIVNTCFPLLMEAIAQTAIITSKQFHQPDYRLTSANCTLGTIKSFIQAWLANIEQFHTININSAYEERKKKADNKLKAMVTSGLNPQAYANTVANWAANVAGFPTAKKDLWTSIIRSCASKERMTKVDITDLRELLAYCEDNLDLDSLYTMKLLEVLRKGIEYHANYLGDYSLASISIASLTGKNFLESQQSALLAETKNKEAVHSILEVAPTTAPVRGDYPTNIAFIKAKLAYRVAQQAAAKKSPTAPVQVPTVPTVPSTTPAASTKSQDAMVDTEGANRRRLELIAKAAAKSRDNHSSDEANYDIIDIHDIDISYYHDMDEEMEDCEDE